MNNDTIQQQLGQVELVLSQLADSTRGFHLTNFSN